MKDILLVYYSLEGNTQFAAETAAGCASMDVERLVPLKEPPKKGFGKFFWGGKSVVMNERPELEALKFSPDSYGTIIFAFPVWASSYPPAVATYLKEHALSGKTVYIHRLLFPRAWKRSWRKRRSSLKAAPLRILSVLPTPPRTRTKTQPSSKNL